MRTATLLTIGAFLVTTGTSEARAPEKKERDAVDDKAAKASRDIKDCGKTFKVTFDWKAYDALDWNGIKRDKQEYYAMERSNLEHLGEGVNKLCADKDYKAALSKINTIIYRSTNDDSIRVRAKVSGSTLTFENYTFGSTRFADDYEEAARAAI